VGTSLARFAKYLGYHPATLAFQKAFEPINEQGNVDPHATRTQIKGGFEEKLTQLAGIYLHRESQLDEDVILDMGLLLLLWFGCRPNEVAKLLDPSRSTSRLVPKQQWFKMWEAGMDLAKWKAPENADESQLERARPAPKRGWHLSLGAGQTKTKVQYEWLLPDCNSYAILGRLMERARPLPFSFLSQASTGTKEYELWSKRFLARMQRRMN
jgi:hypothetical protein